MARLVVITVFKIIPLRFCPVAILHACLKEIGRIQAVTAKVTANSQHLVQAAAVHNIAEIVAYLWWMLLGSLCLLTVKELSPSCSKQSQKSTADH